MGLLLFSATVKHKKMCHKENKFQFSTSPNQQTIINHHEEQQTTGSINFDDN